MTGGELVRDGCRRAGLTQREFAEPAGTTQSSIARLESGRTSTRLEDMVRLVRLTRFDLRVQLMLDGDSAVPLSTRDNLSRLSDALRALEAKVRNENEDPLRSAQEPTSLALLTLLQPDDPIRRPRHQRHAQRHPGLRRPAPRCQLRDKR